MLRPLHLLAATLAFATSPAVAQNFFHDKASFDDSYDGPSIEECYDAIPNSSGWSIPDATMDAYFGETDYTNTTIHGPGHQVFNGYYNASSTSFRLDFAATSISTNNGVTSAGIEYVQFSNGWHAFITLADGLTIDYDLPATDGFTPRFLGLTSPVPIVSIAVGPAGGTGGIVSGGSFWLRTVCLGSFDPGTHDIGGGCPLQPAPYNASPVSSTGTFAIRCQTPVGPPCDGGMQSVLFGRCSPFPIQLPIGVGCGLCDLWVNPVWGVATNNQLVIAPGLAPGFAFCAQCACITTPLLQTPCIRLSATALVVVGP